jgi:hypothetical protein
VLNLIQATICLNIHYLQLRVQTQHLVKEKAVASAHFSIQHLNKQAVHRGYLQIGEEKMRNYYMTPFPTDMLFAQPLLSRTLLTRPESSLKINLPRISILRVTTKLTEAEA